MSGSATKATRAHVVSNMANTNQSSQSCWHHGPQDIFVNSLGGMAPSMRWARLITRTSEHGHRAVCGGGLFEVIVDEEEGERGVNLCDDVAERAHDALDACEEEREG